MKKVTVRFFNRKNESATSGNSGVGLVVLGLTVLATSPLFI